MGLFTVKKVGFGKTTAGETKETSTGRIVSVLTALGIILTAVASFISGNVSLVGLIMAILTSLLGVLAAFGATQAYAWLNSLVESGAIESVMEYLQTMKQTSKKKK